MAVWAEPGSYVNHKWSLVKDKVRKIVTEYAENNFATFNRINLFVYTMQECRWFSSVETVFFVFI